jgi:cytochrome c-type biogenesis protein CcmH/NrfF
LTPRRAALGALVLAGGLLAAGAAPAAQPGAPAVGRDAQGWSYGLWNELMSPFCPGRTLADCPSEQAEKLREWIVAQEEGGRARDEVEGELFASFGDVLRQAPAAEGFGLAAYVIPIAIFCAGGALVVLFLARRGGPPLATAPRVVVVDPELQRELEEQIAGPGPG